MYHARDAQFVNRVACGRQTTDQIPIVTDDLTQVDCFDCVQLIRWRPGYRGQPPRCIKVPT